MTHGPNIAHRRVTKCLFRKCAPLIASRTYGALPCRFVSQGGFPLRRRSSCPQVFHVAEFGERKTQHARLAGGQLLLRRGRVRFPVAGAVAAGRSTRPCLCPQLRRIALQHLTMPIAGASNHRASSPGGPVETSWFGNDHFRSFDSLVRGRRSGILEQLNGHIKKKKTS